MKLLLLVVLQAFALCMVSSSAFGSASCETAAWTAFDEVSAQGSLGDVGITVTSSATAPLVGFFGNHFGKGDEYGCGSWDGDLPLGHDDLAVVASYVNAGDFQEFLFSTTLDETLFYIENFDSSSMADITFFGAEAVTLVDASSSISFDSVAGDDGVVGKLTTSNAGYDGEGDAAFLVVGDISGIRVDYTAGEGANGVFYTFAEPCAVPEPTSLLVMAGLFGIGCVVRIARRD